MYKYATVIATAATLAFAGPAWACRCPPQTPQSAYRMADAVVLVRIDASKDVDRYRRVYQVAVERAWKRQLARPEIATRRTTCMLDMKPGARYLVYVTQRRGGDPESSLCSGSLPLEKAGEAIAWLDRNGKSAR
jgi:hypothetical protein